MITKNLVSLVVFWLVTMGSVSGICQPSHKKFAKQIASRNLTELFDSLSKHDNGYYNVVDAGAMHPSFLGKPVVPIRAVLIDYRVARIYEELLGMERAEASSLVQSQLKKKFNQYKQDWTEVEGMLLEYNRHGMTAMLFLSLNFCEESLFDEACCDWLYWYYVNRGKDRYFLRRAGPDTLTLINLYAIRFMKRGNSVESLNEKVSELCSQLNCGELPEFMTYKLMRFRASPGSEKKDSGKAASAKTAVLAEFPVFYNWGMAAALANATAPDLILQARGVSKARSWVRPSDVVTRWINSAEDLTLGSLEKLLRNHRGY